MRMLITTDMEGCAGILNFPDWVYPDGKYYETGKMLLTQEVNAAICGFMENGFDEIIVLDAHGHGGIDITQLDKRALYQRGFPGPYPLGLRSDYDAMAWVGQHAKASTPFAHLAHTSSKFVVDQRINNISIGEFGMGVFMGASLGLKPIFGSGDLAFCQEASALCPNIHTVSVKEGLHPGTGEECTPDEYRDRNIAAIHVTPAVARQKIYEGACVAAKDFLENPDKFTVEPLHGPITVEIDYRTNYPGVHTTKHYEHPDSVVEALNMSWADR